jgi:hypothetical protein
VEGGRTRHNGCTCGGRLTWKEVGHMAGDGWMMRWEKDHGLGEGEDRCRRMRKGERGEPHRTAREENRWHKR